MTIIAFSYSIINLNVAALTDVMSPIDSKPLHDSRLVCMANGTVLYPFLVRFVRERNLTHSIMKYYNISTGCCENH